MSDTPTTSGGNPDGANPTRREGATGSAGATRREGATGSAGATRREGSGDVPAQRNHRLRLPDQVAVEYRYVNDVGAGGGEADIALLENKATGEQVIFKYYKAGMSPDPLAMQALSSARGAHVVTLLDFHDGPDGTWELQEYCAIGSMRDWVDRLGGRLSKQALTAVVRELAEALDHLQELGSGIAHRDLKPANVLVRADDPLDLVLADFGLARTHQAITHLTTTLKGTWHYAAPEVYSLQSSARSDWFALGAMVYEFYCGRKLFSMDDGTEVGEDDARARCLARNYSTDLVDDPRWKLLVDGLLTWDKDHRWGGAAVAAWLEGKSPPVHRDAVQAAQARGVGYRPNWSPTLVHTPAELADQLRLHWDGASDELAGRPDEKMTRFLQGIPGMEGAVRVVTSNEAPGPKLVRLQAILDPDGPIHYNGVPLDSTSIGQRIKIADEGDARALDWLASVLDERILTAYAEVTGSQQAAHADYLLGRWKVQADAATQPLPAAYQALAREAFRSALPELFGVALSRAGGDA